MGYMLNSYFTLLSGLSHDGFEFAFLWRGPNADLHPTSQALIGAFILIYTSMNRMLTDIKVQHYLIYCKPLMISIHNLRM